MNQKWQFLILVLVFSGCLLTPHRVFDRIKGQEEITIYLHDYKLDSIPPFINELQGVKSLCILKDREQSGWTIYPPLSALGIDDEPLHQVPEEITELTSLKTLKLINLGLASLPDNIWRLEILDTLDIAHNFLNISLEADKLKAMTWLKYLRIGSNFFPKEDLEALRKALPNTTIDMER